MRKSIRLDKYQIRTCRTLHHCVACNRDIKSGERYHDGGYGLRSHVKCVRMRIAPAEVKGGGDG